MELQSFINQNDNYLDKLKEQNVYIRKYTPLNLCITKTYYNKDYDYEKYPWLKYCRGAVINIKTNRIVCIPPCKATKENNNIQEIIDNYDETKTYEALLDGTMINMFYHNDQWMIATRSNIGAKNSWDGKIPFSKMFLEILGDEWFNELYKDHCYSFSLAHKKNRIVTPIETNMIFLVECYRIGDTIEKRPLQEIQGIYNIITLDKEKIEQYRGNLYFSIKGFTIKKKGLRINWINPNHSYVNNLKMNHNDKFLNYISLRQTRLLTEYLKFFPEDQYSFRLFRDQYNNIKQKLHDGYLSHFVKKEKELNEIEYPLRPLIFDLHNFYKQTKNIITIKVVSDYLHNLPGKKIMFINKYLR